MLCVGFLFCVQNGASSCFANDSNSVQSQNTIKCPIIMYHSTAPNIVAKYNTKPKLLEEDLLYLKSNGYNPVFLSQVVDYCKNNTPLPKKPIVITFDDGYTNNFKFAFDILKKHNIKSTHSIIGAFTDNNYQNGVLKPTNSHMDYTQLNKMKESGIVEFGNHTYDLHKIKGARFGVKKYKHESVVDYSNMLKADLQKCQNALINNIGVEPKVFCYPFGAYNDIAKEVIIQMGFDCALICTEGINNLDDNLDLYELKRFNRDNTKPTKEFFNKILDNNKNTSI